MKNPETFAQALRRELEEANLSQSAVAEKIGMKQAEMNRRASGRFAPKLDFVRQLVPVIPGLLTWAVRYLSQDAVPVKASIRKDVDNVLRGKE